MRRLFLLAASLASLLHRSENILLYPERTLFQFTIGVSVPVSTNKRGSVVFSSAFQFNYKLPSNLSELEPTIMPARQSRDLDLRDTYAAIENLLNRQGWRDGRKCLLRTICELAETPFARTRGDILEEVIHLILTPSEDLPGSANSTHRSVDQLYREAERLGRSGGDCVLAYPDCIQSPLEAFTEIAFPRGDGAFKRRPALISTPNRVPDVYSPSPWTKNAFDRVQGESCV